MIREHCKIYERYVNTPSSVAERLYYYPQWIGRFVCHPDFFILRNNLSSILLLYTVSGSGKLLYRGNEYSIEPNQLVLIDCRESHTYYPTGNEDWEFYFIHFSGSNSFDLYNHIYELNEGVMMEGNDTLRNYIDRCMQECRDKSFGHEARLSKYLNNILYFCIFQIQSASDGYIIDICEYIAEHCNDALTTTFLATKFGFSRCYLSTYFKKHTGSTIHEYLIYCRLSKAKKLLLKSELSIEQIASDVGFKDSGTFRRAFCEKEKMTPLQYKKHYASSHKNFKKLHE